jgi:hypothetical protein
MGALEPVLGPRGAGKSPTRKPVGTPTKRNRKEIEKRSLRKEI